MQTLHDLNSVLIEGRIEHFDGVHLVMSSARRYSKGGAVERFEIGVAVPKEAIPCGGLAPAAGLSCRVVGRLRPTVSTTLLAELVETRPATLPTVPAAARPVPCRLVAAGVL